jgi:phage N-6-adenine-methyltransferase
MNTELMFSSKTDMWATPQELYDKLDSAFKFETDVCATSDNAKCKKYFTLSDNGLEQEWTGVCWMNPPYGRKISR